MSDEHSERAFLEMQEKKDRRDEEENTGLEEVLLVRYYDNKHVRLTITMTYDLVVGGKIVELIEFVTERKEDVHFINSGREGYTWVNRDLKESLSAALVDICDWDSEGLIDEQISIWEEIKKGGNL